MGAHADGPARGAGADAPHAATTTPALQQQGVGPPPRSSPRSWRRAWRRRSSRSGCEEELRTMNLTRRNATPRPRSSEPATSACAPSRRACPPRSCSNPRKALAQGTASGVRQQRKAQYIIFNTSGNGDPINASVPGHVRGPEHRPHARIRRWRPTSLHARRPDVPRRRLPWTTLPANVLDAHRLLAHR